MIRRPPRSTLDRSSAASDVYKRQVVAALTPEPVTDEPIAAAVESLPEAAAASEESEVSATAAQPADVELQAETEAEQTLQPGPAVWDGTGEGFQVEISPEDYAEFAATEGDGEENLEAERERKRKRSKKQRLVFDETRGAVVSVRRHKREPSAWGEFDEE